GDADEQDVEHEGHAADRLVQRARAGGQGREQVPHRDHGADIDLLAGVAEAPPDHAVPGSVGGVLEDADTPEPSGDQRDGAVQDGPDGDDDGRQRAEHNQRYAALVGLVALGDVQTAQKV